MAVSDQTYPFGYGDQWLTWDQMMTKTTVYNLHPEMLRRFKALIEYAASCGVPLGVGTGWRVQPDPPPPGFAKPGNSYHESVPVNPVSATALAIDTVPTGSWPWMHDHCGAYGIRHFKYVGSEPWHAQPAEISTSRKFATTMPALVRWELPGDEGDDMPLSDDDIQRVATAVWNHKIGDPAQGEDKPAYWRLKQIQGMCRKYLGGFTDDAPLPEETTLARIDKNTKP